MNKRGVTVASLSIYIILFTIFTIFLVNISSGLNDNLFNNKAEANNYTNLMKLQTNIENSAVNSSDVTSTNNTLTFSNGDVYTYDSTNNIIKKNGGVFIKDVSAYLVTVSGESSKLITISVTFNKYLNNLQAEIKSFVEG